MVIANTFPVRQGVDPNYLRNTLTKDISPLEAIYDLIDNAVDAARERRMGGKGRRLDIYGLPADYSGSRIRLRIGSDSITLWDNCTGIDEATLADQAFVTGFVSEHRYGIGGFGIGMKRALFRLGHRYVLATDTASSAAVMRFDQSQLAKPNTALTAQRIRSSGQTKTLLRIDQLSVSVAHELGGMSIADVARHLSRRYGLFLSKGLRLCVNGFRVPAFGPWLRKAGPLPNASLNLTDQSGVNIYVESGMHEGYRLRHESDYAAAKNTQLTDQYGWYFVCNDRIVKIASREKELGWTANWHQEYYGFVGWVRFVAKDPENLPWDTKKTQIDPHSPSFRAVVGKLQEFADRYRNGNRQARKNGPAGSSSGSPPSGGDAQQPLPKTSVNGKGNAPKATAEFVPNRMQTHQDENDHNENWSFVLPNMTVSLTHPKIRALVFEAKGLAVATPYAGSMLFRTIVEFALFERLKKAGEYARVRQMYFEQQEASGRGLTADQKKTFRPTLAQALEWLNKNDEFFPQDVRRECVTARNKFGRHLKELNGVVHEGDLIDSGKLKIIRNDTLPLLRFLLEEGDP